MPSPFPGMDPYLEGELWMGFHHELAVEVKRQLAPLLQPHYYPFTEKYFFLESNEIGIVEERINPDVGIVQGKRASALSRRPHSLPSPVIMEVPMPLEVPHYRVAIRDVNKRRLVTVIEFLSPTNKHGGGRTQYLQRRDKILVSSVHLVEIDLLRSGARLPMKGDLPEGAYFVLVSRAGTRPKTRVWPIAIDEPLPSFAVPLRKKDEGVTLDLQKAVRSVYDLGTYDGIIDYQEEPDVPLDGEEASWADGLLRARGLRR